MWIDDQEVSAALGGDDQTIGVQPGHAVGTRVLAQVDRVDDLLCHQVDEGEARAPALAAAVVTDRSERPSRCHGDLVRADAGRQGGARLAACQVDQIDCVVGLVADQQRLG